MKDNMPLIQLLKDLKVAYNVITMLPTVTCKVFEGNQSCISFAESKNPPTRTKDIAIECHHFRNLVDDIVIKINYIDTEKQLEGILTLPIKSNQCFKLSSS